MNSNIRLSENISELRRKKNITQEELAEFMGVTKASVSKWERGSSLPDILLIPQLASYFDVTVDELMGYCPQLSGEQIKAAYHRLAAEFAGKPFEEVMEESERMVKNYYSCYPFLVQTAILWLNHFMLAATQERQREILDKIIRLCEHITGNCKDIGICEDAVSIKSMVSLQLGKVDEVVELLEETQNPYRLDRQNEGLLLQAYLMQHENEKAESYAQIEVFQKLLQLVALNTQLLIIYAADREKCETVIRRTDGLLALFELEKLHPNMAACYQLQAALTYAGWGVEEETYVRLEKYTDIVCELLQTDVILHGDAFFTRLDEWIDGLELGAQSVRDRRLIVESAKEVFAYPQFAALPDQARLQKMKQRIS